MGWELLIDSDRDYGVFFCNTADEAFGPIINMHYCDAGTFYEWWNEIIGDDPRSMDTPDLHAAIQRFQGIQYDIKFIVAAPDGTEVPGEFHSMTYASVKNLFDMGWTQEQFDQWGCEDWSNIMASILKSRDCDMDGFGGELSGHLYPPPSWASEDTSSGPQWKIVAINNGVEHKSYGTYQTWDWYDGHGEVVHTGPHSADDIRTKKKRNS
jgi:hypothetical protein